MLIRRSEGFPQIPAAGTVRTGGVSRARSADADEGQYDQITLSAGGGQDFRAMAASLSQQVRTYNTTGKIQDLHRQVSAGEYRPDARETAARMLLMTEGE